MEQNERKIEDAKTDIIYAIEQARTGAGVLTLVDIAHAIKEAVGDDCASLAGLLMVISRSKDKIDTETIIKEQNKFVVGEINRALGM